MRSDDQLPPPVNRSQAHSARRYDFWLGGKDNFEVDRQSARAIEAVFPSARTAAWDNRRFVRRAVRHLAKAGVRQFVDVGCGLPAAYSADVHEVAQQVDPTARVVYVDNDPMVLVHIRALLLGTPEGRVEFLDADLREPETILGAPELADVLDLTQPVGLILASVLDHIADHDQARHAVRALVDALPAGSYLALSHATTDFMTAEVAAELREALSGEEFAPRCRAQVAEFFTGLNLIPPGLATPGQWGDPAPTTGDQASVAAAYAGVARKPRTGESSREGQP
ncbi:SAM-dependent methyltransferase [Actinoplanes sp. NPDC051859]|uniref:SAM-dependent methyltransferase n=1 Tax=Actinoplanes sp. NPDC051859 TaxID=3363909 RepID=UPI00379658AE